MNLSKLALLFSVTCSLSVFANETQTIDTELGTFQVKDLGQSMSLTHNYQISFGNETIGTTEQYIELRAGSNFNH